MIQCALSFAYIATGMLNCKQDRFFFCLLLLFSKFLVPRDWTFIGVINTVIFNTARRVEEARQHIQSNHIRREVYYLPLAEDIDSFLEVSKREKRWGCHNFVLTASASAWTVIRPCLQHCIECTFETLRGACCSYVDETPTEFRNYRYVERSGIRCTEK